MHVARKGGRFFDVGKLEHARREALKACGGASVRRKPIFEGLQVEREFLGVETALFHSRYERIVIMDALTAAVYLKAAEEKVEAARVWRLRRVFIGGEGAFLGGKASDEYEIRLLFFFRPLADAALVFGLHVRRLFFAELLKRFFQREDRNFFREERNGRSEACEHIGKI